MNLELIKLLKFKLIVLLFYFEILCPHRGQLLCSSFVCPHLLWLVFITLIVSTCSPSRPLFPECMKPVSGVSASCSSRQRASRFLNTAGPAGLLFYYITQLLVKIQFDMINFWFCFSLQSDFWFLLLSVKFVKWSFCFQQCNGFILKSSLHDLVTVKSIFGLSSKMNYIEDLQR